MSRKAVFLDRDGVINEDVGYLSSPGQLRILPGVPEALKLLRSRGFLRVLVTNQSGVARGHFTEQDLLSIHTELLKRLRDAATELDAIYYCPHLKEGSVEDYAHLCGSRKPGAGMIEIAARDLDVDLADSFLVGDTLSDIQAAKAAGVRSIFIGDEEQAKKYEADASAKDLAKAAELIADWGPE